MCYSICRTENREPVFKEPLSMKVNRFVVISLLVVTLILGLVAIVHEGQPGLALNGIGLWGGLAMVVVPTLVLLQNVRNRMNLKKELKAHCEKEFPTDPYEIKKISYKHHELLLIKHPDVNESPREELLVFKNRKERADYIAQLGDPYTPHVDDSF